MKKPHELPMDAYKEWEKKQERKVESWINCVKNNFSEDCKDCEFYEGCKGLKKLYV